MAPGPSPASCGRACSRRPDQRGSSIGRLFGAAGQVEQGLPGLREQFAAVHRPAGPRPAARSSSAAPQHCCRSPSRRRPGRRCRRRRRPAAAPGQFRRSSRRCGRVSVSAFSMLRADCVTRCCNSGRSAASMPVRSSMPTQCAVAGRTAARRRSCRQPVSWKKCSPRCSHTGCSSASAAPMAVVPTAALRQVDADARDQRGRAGRCGRSGRGRRRPRRPVGQDGEVAGVWRSRGRAAPAPGGPPSPAGGSLLRRGAAPAAGSTSKPTRSCGRWPDCRQRRHERSIQAPSYQPLTSTSVIELAFLHHGLPGAFDLQQSALCAWAQRADSSSLLAGLVRSVGRPNAAIVPF